MSEMANICSVPIDFIAMRGQGIKLLSYIAKKCREKDTLMPVVEKGDLDEKVKALTKAKESGNIEDIRSSMDALNASWSAVASKLYDSTKQEPNASEQQTNQDAEKKEKKEGEIEDADFEVVD